MSADPKSLARDSACWCLTGKTQRGAMLYLLDKWANAGGTPPCTLPTAPVDLGASAGNGQVILTWPAGVGATGYNIKRALVTGGPYAVIGTSAASPYVDLTAVNGTAYYYVVSSTNACGESAGNSLESHATPHLPIPDILTQDFESGVMPPGWSDSGSPAWNFTPALLGSYSLQVPAGATAIVTLSASEDEVFLFFMFSLGSLVGGAVIVTLFDNTATAQFVIAADFVGTGFRIYDAGFTNNAETVAGLMTNTLYYCWLHYKLGSGANAVCTAAFSTSLSEPTSGNNFASIANATSTKAIDTINFANGNNPVVDHLGIATFDMPTGW